MGLIDLTTRAEVLGAAGIESDQQNTRVRNVAAALAGWTAIDWSGSLYLASSGLWTVVAGSQNDLSYRRLGNFLTLSFVLQNTTVSATPASLRLMLPLGLVVRSAKAGTFAYLDNGTAGTGVWTATPGDPYLVLQKNLNATAWAAAAGTTSVYGQADLDVE